MNTKECTCCATILLMVFSIQLQAQKKIDGSSGTDHFVTVDGHKMHYEVAGSGSPAVVLESGLGDGAEPWSDVFIPMAKYTQVIAYDRAGIGQSEESTGEKSFTRIAKDLHAMLSVAKINPPYILVGHSLGGALIRAFAYLYPEDVKGMVFIDPVSENSFDSVTEMQKRQMVAQQDSLIVRAPPAIQKEWKYLATETLNGSVALNSFGRLPPVPVALMIAGKNRPPNWIPNLLQWYKEKLSGQQYANLYVFQNYGHYIQSKDPDQVISAIERVMFPDPANSFSRVIEEKGIDSAVNYYHRMIRRYPVLYMSEDMLNRLGYEQLGGGHFKEAIALFRLNVESFPKSYNTYDSLAEAYAAAGDNKDAIINYEKSLLLNPGNTHAAKQLKTLKSK
jgi:pimeloyl-ACP methyl ester carboxylesterase